MNLIIDEGNTAFKLALFEGDELVKCEVFEPFERQEMHSWISDALTSIKHVIISSVVNKGLDLSRYKFNEIILDMSTRIPLANDYETPESLGKDRLANAVGAWFRNPNGNSLVVDLGTCIKYDLVTSDGRYKGGNISPGINMRYASLNHFTAKLPLLKREKIEFNYGIDTNTSIHNGVEQGAYHEINGFIQKYQEQFPDLTIFMTGGDAKFFDKPFICDIFADSNLTLFGLNKILMHNAENA
jgi:type III pantothenate kinase